MYRICAINLGSTSTKIAYYEDETCVCKDSISHSARSLAAYASVFDQMALRRETVVGYLRDHGVSLDQLDALVSRGPQTEPVSSGVYRINRPMVEQAESGAYGVHVCSVGCRIAYDLAQEHGFAALTADTPCTDEFEPLARYSGLKEVSRHSRFQALNHKAMARFYAQGIGKRYEDLNLVVAMLGGGISVVAHKRGRMVDGPDALEGDGAFSNNRCCSVPVGQLVRLCYAGTYDLEGMLRHVNGEAGLYAYLRETDTRAIEASIAQGDEHAREVLDAMCYQTAKDIGAYATVLEGDVDAILMIGGMANSSYITSRIAQRVSFIAPVEVLPGEREMESLCLSALGALRGDVEVREFAPRAK